MAELILMVNTLHPGHPEHYQDGDILCALNRRRIRHVHAEHICKPAGFTDEGLRVNGSLAELYLSRTKRYRFERVSDTEVLKTNLIDPSEVPYLVSGTPNEKGEQMDVALYVERRLEHAGHLVFGIPGREIWYGSSYPFDHAALDLIWNDIETLTPEREADHQLWPLTEIEKRHFLDLTVNDFTDDEAATLTEPDIDHYVDRRGEEVSEHLKKRLNRVPWQDLAELSGATKTDALKRSRPVDNRATATPLERSVIVESKVRSGREL